MNEARNTFNAIAGKLPVIKSFWCAFGFHRWQQWSDVKETTKPGFSSLTHVIQDRYCDKCHRYDHRVIGG